MVTRLEYREDGPHRGRPARQAEIDYMDECTWRVWVTDGARCVTTFRRNLNTAQGCAREFLRTGTFPR